jgi:hypothetical protein
MKKMFFLCLLGVWNTLQAQVAVNLPTGQTIDPLASFQVCGTVRIDSLPPSVSPTHVVVLDANDSILHKMSFTSFISLVVQSAPVTVPIIRTYTSNSVWVKPPGLKYIVVEVVGGGGGGGRSGNANGNAGAGGGGGGYSRKFILTSGLGSTEIITVGIGGLAGGILIGANGGNGGISSFGTHCQATGGVGGGGPGAAGGTGGVGSLGDFSIVGNGGGGGTSATSTTGGTGGSSFFGGGSEGGGSDAIGPNGNNYGGGGGGGCRTSGTNRNGGFGASGIVIVTEYY